MTLIQKQAWFNLGVVVASVIVVLALTPFLGRGALGGFGLLGFLGLMPLLVRQKGGGVVVDERDREVCRRSMLAAYTVFWVVFVAACMALPTLYGWSGSVPVIEAQSSVFVAWILVVGVSSVATLIQYGLGGTTDASGA